MHIIFNPDEFYTDNVPVKYIHRNQFRTTPENAQSLLHYVSGTARLVEYFEDDQKTPRAWKIGITIIVRKANNETTGLRQHLSVWFPCIEGTMNAERKNTPDVHGLIGSDYAASSTQNVLDRIQLAYKRLDANRYGGTKDRLGYVQRFYEAVLNILEFQFY